MNPGRLRTRVSIQQLVPSINEVGEEIGTWTTIVERWGELRTLRGKEFEGAAIASEARYELRIRYENALSDMTTKWRVVRNSQIFDIQIRITALSYSHIGKAPKVVRIINYAALML